MPSSTDDAMSAASGPSSLPGGSGVVGHPRDGIRGEVKLLAAVLADAIGLLAGALRRREHDLPPTLDQSEAWAWVFEATSDAPWTFVWVAQALGRDADALRNHLARQVRTRARRAGRLRPYTTYSRLAGAYAHNALPRAAGGLWARGVRRVAVQASVG